jgi:hypothetical protein
MPGKIIAMGQAWADLGKAFPCAPVAGTGHIRAPEETNMKNMLAALMALLNRRNLHLTENATNSAGRFEPPTATTMNCLPLAT